MHSRRTQKAAQAIREVVSMAILTEMNDPRVQDVTVTQVEVAPDMRQAKVYVSIRGNETKQRLCLQGLRSAAGYLQAKLASRIETRYTPRLEFVLDLGVKKSIEMAQILGRVLPPKPVETADIDAEDTASEETAADDPAAADPTENQPQSDEDDAHGEP
ncbi:MAG TPA: 30S ribosome-binding factor RbfA [Pirellulales bacterium]